MPANALKKNKGVLLDRHRAGRAFEAHQIRVAPTAAAAGGADPFRRENTAVSAPPAPHQAIRVVAPATSNAGMPAGPPSRQQRRSPADDDGTLRSDADQPGRSTVATGTAATAGPAAAHQIALPVEFAAVACSPGSARATIAAQTVEDGAGYRNAAGAAGQCHAARSPARAAVAARTGAAPKASWTTGRAAAAVTACAVDPGRHFEQSARGDVHVTCAPARAAVAAGLERAGS
jgi:hypothetical protein